MCASLFNERRQTLVRKLQNLGSATGTRLSTVCVRRRWVLATSDWCIQQTFINQMIEQWWFRLGLKLKPVADSLNIWIACFTIALHGWSIRFHTFCDGSLSFQDDNDEVSAHVTKPTLWHVYVSCVSQCSIKTALKRDWWFWHRFVTNILRIRKLNR